MRATEALAESEETFRLAMANAPIGMAAVALDGSFIEVNAALCAIVGLDRERSCLLRPSRTSRMKQIWVPI